MITRHRLFVLSAHAAFATLLGFHLAAGQEAPRSGSDTKSAPPANAAVLLQVAGEVTHPISLSGDEFAKLPRQTVKAKGHDGVDSQFEGVRLVDILAKAGVPTGKELRGPAMALYLVIDASDGYRAVFALSELDPSFTDRVILLADRRDGKPLSVKDGPLQVIVPGDKKHARWVRQVIRLKVGRG
jgi:DMSO/TMAO reductase YedYZ molybdopterin-dependent catalytic subunit